MLYQFYFLMRHKTVNKAFTKSLKAATVDNALAVLKLYVEYDGLLKFDDVEIMDVKFYEIPVDVNDQ